MGKAHGGLRRGLHWGGGGGVSEAQAYILLWFVSFAVFRNGKDKASIFDIICALPWLVCAVISYYKK